MRAFKQRHLFAVAALCGSFAALAACGDDDDTGSGGTAGSGGSTGGTAGRGGTGGKDAGTVDSGRGGSAGSTGGSGGVAGTAGSSGAGGKGGTAGTAGAGGTAGKGGSAGTAGSSGKDGGAGTTGDGGADAPTDGGVANVRVAHLSPGAPAVDFCLAVHGTTVFSGPMLAGQGVATGLPYAAVTKYLTVSAGQYDIRIVAPGAANCATSLGGLPDQTNLPAIAAGGAVTIAAVGEIAPGDGGGQPFGLKAFVDDTSVANTMTKLRFVHASSGTPSVDVGTNGGAIFNGVFNDVAFGNTATATNGYVQIAPLDGVEISARAHGSTSDVVAAPDLDLPSGAITTAFAIGKIGNTLSPLKILLCTDNAPPVGALTPCNVVGDVPKRAHVRVAHLSPDAPAIDICLAPMGGQFITPGLLRRLNVTSGLAYAQVTTYLDLPPASFTVRLVAATATDCSTPVVPDTASVAVTDNLYATIAALGDFTTLPPTDGGTPDAGTSDGGAADGGATPSSFGLKVFVDNKAAPIPAGNINLRFIHASPGTAAVDVGLGSGGSFTPVFTNVGFRNFGAGVGIDLNGYVSRAPLAAQTISARLTGGTTDAIVVPNVNIAADSIATAFAIGKVGNVDKPLKVLLCTDSAAPSGVLTPCNVVP